MTRMNEEAARMLSSAKSVPSTIKTPGRRFHRGHSLSSLRVSAGNPLTMHENEITGTIVDASYKIHTTLGPGLLESVYEKVLEFGLVRRGLDVRVQQPIPVIYDEVRLEIGFRADIIVGNKVVIEVKSVDIVAPVHAKQLRTYLRLMDLKVGLLINFNVNLIKEGITRVVNNL